MAKKMPNRMSGRAGKLLRRMQKEAERTAKYHAALRQLAYPWARAQVAKEQ